MGTIQLLSVGAAHGLVDKVAAVFTSSTGSTIQSNYDTVGATADKLRRGEPADVAILSATYIRTLIEEGLLLDETAVDLGRVEAAIAVRDKDPVIPIADEEGLRRCLLAAPAIYVPDVKSSTAGGHFYKVLNKLEIWGELESRIRMFPNGATAMRSLATSDIAGAIGCTQSTEIVSMPGLKLAAALPGACALTTMYSVAVSTTTKSREDACALIRILTGADQQPQRQAAGFMAVK